MMLTGSVFVVTLFGLFGPKIGLLDTTALVSGCYLIFSLLVGKRPKVPQQLMIFVFLQVSLLLYSCIIYSIASEGHETDLNLVMRAVRSLLTTVTLGVIFYNSEIEVKSFVKVALAVLLCHPIAMGIQLLVPETLDFFAQYWTLGKYPPSLRAFGLTAGLDTSGYFCIFGQVFAASLSLTTGRYFRYNVAYLIFVTAVFFTARNAILITLVLFLIYAFYSMRVKRSSVRNYILLQGGAMCVVLILVVLPLLSYSFFGGSEFLVIADVEVNLHTAYSQNTFDDYLAYHLTLPRSIVPLVMGNGLVPPVDPGYVRLIFSTGLIGLSITVGSYFVFVAMARRVLVRVLRTYRYGGSEEDAWHLSIAQFMLMILLLTFVFNIKHFYFFTRGFFEIFIIMYFYALRTSIQSQHDATKERALVN